MRTKNSEIEELKKKIGKIQAKQETLIREAEEAIKLSKQIVDKVEFEFY